MALRYDTKHNRFRNVRYNTPHNVDYETLMQSNKELLTIDETYELTYLLSGKMKMGLAGGAVSLLSIPMLGRVPKFVGLHGYTRAFVRAAFLILPWYIPSRYFGTKINQLVDSAVDRRLQEFYVNPISRQFVI